MPKTLKKTLFFITYLVVVTLVFLALTEVSVRVLNLAPPQTNSHGNMVPDLYLPFKPRPNSIISGRSKYDEFDYHVEINSVGLRDFERPYKKPEGVFRILGLGDSTTYGGAALFEESYLRRVERMLNERPGDHPIIEIIKAGVPRYYPEPERMMLEYYGVRYEPDAITIGFGSSDVIDTLQGLGAITIHAPDNQEPIDGPDLRNTFLFKQSHLAHLLLDRYYKYKNPRPTNWDEIYKPDGMYEKQWQEIENELSRINDIARSIEARMIILYIPDFTLFQRNEERHYPPLRLSEWAMKNNVSFADATPALIEIHASTTTPLYWARDRHPTPAGYQVIAETLYKALIEYKLVP